MVIRDDSVVVTQHWDGESFKGHKVVVTSDCFL